MRTISIPNPPNPLRRLPPIRTPAPRRGDEDDDEFVPTQPPDDEETLQ